MAADYGRRLVMRRVGGVVAPLVLLPLAAWVWVSTPAVAGTGDAAPSAPAPTSPDGTPTGEGAAVPTSVLVTATAADDGSFLVVEDVVYDRPTRTVSLRLPEVDGAGPQFTGVRGEVTDLSVAADGGIALRPDGPPAQVALRTAATSVRVSYSWWGSSVATRPSPAGRALAALAPVTDPGTAPVDFRVEGTPVRNISCPLVPGEGYACAVVRDGALATGAPLAPGSAVVLVQLDVT